MRPKNLKKCTKFNWNFQRGGEVLEKISSMGEVWIFSGTTQCKIHKNNEVCIPVYCCLQESQVKEHYFNTSTDFVYSLSPGSKFTKCSSIYLSGILIFETTEEIENWSVESKAKMKCSTKKGNNLLFELLQVPIIKIYC